MKNLGNSEDRASGNEGRGGMGSIKKRKRKMRQRIRRSERQNEIGKDMYKK